MLKTAARQPLFAVAIAAFLGCAVTALFAQQPEAPQPKRGLPAAPPDVASPPPDADRTPTGLVSKRLAPGTGSVHPTAADSVSVLYTGWTTDGRMFDSTYVRGKPSTFPLARVIPGWTEGIQLMVVGEKRRLWIPEELAYKGQEGRPRGMLVFDVDLVDIVQAPTTPPDVAAIPSDAERGRSGLAWKVLRPGTGSRRPSRGSTVTVHYSGWTTDGRMFDSSVARGEPASFRLDQVIQGWTDGVQMMVEGERRRLWIPERLAYQGQRGYPQGMLVFDIELIGIGD